MTIQWTQKLKSSGVLLIALLQSSIVTAGIAATTTPDLHIEGTIKMNSSERPQSQLVCNIGALNQAQRQRINLLINDLRHHETSVKELPNGYSIEFNKNSLIIGKLAEFLSLERLCCPFYDFKLESAAEGGPVSLTLAGPEGVKAIARAEFGIQKIEQRSPHQAAPTRQSPLACSEEALSSAEKQRLSATLQSIRASKETVKELADGYAVELRDSRDTIQSVAEFMSLVRKCSPYFQSTLVVACEGGGLWLQITGRPGVKPLVKEDLGI